MRIPLERNSQSVIAGRLSAPNGKFLDHFNQLSEDNRRLVVRGDIMQWNQLLAETAHDAGVITNEEFVIFQNSSE